MEFRLARQSELPLLTVLWQACFGDKPEEISSFWKALFHKIQVFVAAEGGEIQAMLCALPVSFVDDMGESHEASYLYAVCTAHQHRRQGLCRRLMAYSEEALKKSGVDYCFLCPAERLLFAYYKKLGYETCLFRDRYPTPVEKFPVKISKITPEVYQNLRLMQLWGSFVDYDLPLLSWEQALGEATGAGLYRIEGEDFVCCAAAEKYGTTLKIKELLPNEYRAAASLAVFLGCERVDVCVPGVAEPFALGKSLQGKPIPDFSYLAFAFEG